MTDPARTEVMVGRVVGVLTGLLAIVTLLNQQASIYRVTRAVFSVAGFAPDDWLLIVIWGNVVTTVGARYVFCYVVGSLLGVVYDRTDLFWIESPFRRVLSESLNCSS